MNKIIRSIGMVALVAALGNVFVIEWLKGLHKFSRVTLSFINIFLAAILGWISYKAFEEHIKEDKVGKWIIVILMLLDLGFSQMIYIHYSKLDDIMVAVLNKYSTPVFELPKSDLPIKKVKK